MTLDLRPGEGGTLDGKVLAIAPGTVIENAIGGDADDLIRGNAEANHLRGSRVADRLSGDAGRNHIAGGDIFMFGPLDLVHADLLLAARVVPPRFPPRRSRGGGRRAVAVRNRRHGQRRQRWLRVHRRRSVHGPRPAARLVRDTILEGNMIAALQGRQGPAELRIGLAGGDVTALLALEDFVF